MRFFKIAFQKLFNQTATRSVSVLNKTCDACECLSCIVYSSPPLGRLLAITLQPLQFHLSATLASVIRAALGPRGPVSQLSILTSSLSLPFFLSRHPRFLPVSTFPAHLLSPRQQLRTGDTGVPATRGETAKVMPARTFSSSRLSWQRDPRKEKSWEIL